MFASQLFCIILLASANCQTTMLLLQFVPHSTTIFSSQQHAFNFTFAVKQQQAEIPWPTIMCQIVSTATTFSILLPATNNSSQDTATCLLLATSENALTPGMYNLTLVEQGPVVVSDTLHFFVRDDSAASSIRVAPKLLRAKQEQIVGIEFQAEEKNWLKLRHFINGIELTQCTEQENVQVCQVKQKLDVGCYTYTLMLYDVVNNFSLPVYNDTLTFIDFGNATVPSIVFYNSIVRLGVQVFVPMQSCNNSDMQFTCLMNEQEYAASVSLPWIYCNVPVQAPVLGIRVATQASSILHNLTLPVQEKWNIQSIAPFALVIDFASRNIVFQVQLDRNMTNNAVVCNLGALTSSLACTGALCRCIFLIRKNQIPFVNGTGMYMMRLTFGNQTASNETPFFMFQQGFELNTPVVSMERNSVQIYPQLPAMFRAFLQYNSLSILCQNSTCAIPLLQATVVPMNISFTLTIQTIYATLSYPVKAVYYAAPVSILKSSPPLIQESTRRISFLLSKHVIASFVQCEFAFNNETNIRRDNNPSSTVTCAVPQTDYASNVTLSYVVSGTRVVIDEMELQIARFEFAPLFAFVGEPTVFTLTVPNGDFSHNASIVERGKPKMLPCQQNDTLLTCSSTVSRQGRFKLQVNVNEALFMLKERLVVGDWSKFNFSFNEVISVNMPSTIVISGRLIPDILHVVLQGVYHISLLCENDGIAIICNVPALLLDGQYAIGISTDNTTFIQTNKTLRAYNNVVSIDSIFPQSIENIWNVSVNNMFTITGLMNDQYPVYVRFWHPFFSFITKAALVDNNSATVYMQGLVDAISNSKISLFPIQVTVAISVDQVSWFGNVSVMLSQLLPKLLLSDYFARTTLFIQIQDLSMSIIGSNKYLKSAKSFFLFPLSCISASLSVQQCSTSILPAVRDDFLLIYYNANSKQYVSMGLATVKHFTLPNVTQVQPSFLFQDTPSDVLFYTNSIMPSNATISLINGNQAMQYTPHIVSNGFILRNVKLSNIGDYTMFFYDNSGQSMLQHTLPVPCITPYEITEVATIDSTIDSLFASIPTSLSVTLNLPNHPLPPFSVLVRLSNQLFAATFALRELKGTITRRTSSSVTLSVTIPPLTAFVTAIPVRLPLFANFSVQLFSSNAYWATKQVFFKSTVAMPVLVSASPQVVHKTSETIQFMAINAEEHVTCKFTYDSQVVLEKASAIATSLYTCRTPIVTDATIHELQLQIVNPTTSAVSLQSVSLHLYEAPTIISLTPAKGSTIGNYSIELYALDVDSSVPIYCKFDSLVSPLPCQVLAKTARVTALSCNVVAHEAGASIVALSYNKQTWFPFATAFQFVACSAGYTSASYTTPCLPCPIGYYKPTEGFYDCLPCPIGSYSSQQAAATCQECPTNSTTNSTASIVLEQCICLPFTYKNPRFDRHVPFEYCLTCPIGATCSNFNTTVPLAQFGYWHSEDDPFTFFKCNPEISCLGESFNNCSLGYTSVRCGQCMEGYYKSKSYCLPCQGGAWWRLLVVAVVALLCVVLFFKIFTIKVSHLSSISIILSLFQAVGLLSTYEIKWPIYVEQTTTASSVSLFTTDFLSPSCIFPYITYLMLYILVMSLPLLITIGFVVLLFFMHARNSIANSVSQCWPLPYLETTTSSTKLVRIYNSIVNHIIWFTTKTWTSEERKFFVNRTINIFLTLTSCSYLTVLLQASQVFICQKQPNGSFTMRKSPDIICYSLYSEWIYMIPISSLYILVLVVGAAIFFTFLYFEYVQYRNDAYFTQRYGFFITKFQKRCFFYEGIITSRKMVLSLASLLFNPGSALVLSMACVFFSFLLQSYFVPFKRKMHNILEYVTLLATLILLFLGFLFYMDQFPNQLVKQLLGILVMIVIVVSIALVVCLAVLDVCIRKRQDKKRSKQQVFRKQSILRMQNLKCMELYEQAQACDTSIVIPFKIAFLQDASNASSSSEEYASMPELISASVKQIKKHKCVKRFAALCKKN